MTGTAAARLAGTVSVCVCIAASSSCRSVSCCSSVCGLHRGSKAVKGQHLLGAALIHNVNLHGRKHILHGLVEHTLLRDQRILAAGFLFCLRVLDDLVALSLCLGNLLIAVLVGIVDGRLLALLRVFYIFKRT